MKVEYPDYASEACAPVKMYLRGEFGGHADDVNAYAASLFFAVEQICFVPQEMEKGV